MSEGTNSRVVSFAQDIIYKMSYVLSTLFRQLVILIRHDSVCVINKKKHPKTSKSHQLPPTKDALLIKGKFPGSNLEKCFSVDIRSTISRKTWMGDREKYVVF